jgi:hypothetical protein
MIRGGYKQDFLEVCGCVYVASPWKLITLH